MMNLICLDLEGVLVPEIWIGVAEKTGIEDLRLTTRDVADYDELMQHRLKVTQEHKMTLSDVQEVINTLDPLDGAVEFVDWARQAHQLVILSDTFAEFAQPLMRKLGWPTIFCHSIHTDDNDILNGYTLRQPEQKQTAVNAFKSMNLTVLAAGDSYNDTTMLAAADYGYLFKPPQNVIEEFPQYSVFTEHADLRQAMEASLAAGQL